MFRNIFLLIIVVRADQTVIPDNPYLVDLVDILCKDGGKWILAATGSSGEVPPRKSCIEVTVSDTGTQNGCILVGHNHTIHKTRIIKFLGVNARNETEIISKAPVHQYMIKGKLMPKDHDEVDNEVNWDAAISSPMCWNQYSHKIRNIRYIVTPIDETTEHLYLVAVSTRTPIPEYQVAILTKTKVQRRYLEKMIKMVNYKNFIHLEDRSDSPGLFVNYNLPRVLMQCAEGYDMHDPYDTINTEIVEMQFDSKEPPFTNKDLSTLLVKHHK